MSCENEWQHCPIKDLDRRAPLLWSGSSGIELRAYMGAALRVWQKVIGTGCKSVPLNHKEEALSDALRGRRTKFTWDLHRACHLDGAKFKNNLLSAAEGPWRALCWISRHVPVTDVLHLICHAFP